MNMLKIQGVFSLTALAIGKECVTHVICYYIIISAESLEISNFLKTRIY